MTPQTSARLSLAIGALALLALSRAGCAVYSEDLLDDAAGVTAGGGNTSSSGGKGGTGEGGDDGTGGSLGGGSNTGGADGGAGGSVSGTGASASTGGTAARTYDLIDDMEMSDPTIRKADTRNGRWNTYNDGSDGTQVPAADFTLMQALGGDSPTEESTFSAYTQGSGFTLWGSVLNVTMHSAFPTYEETPTYDASAYSGVSFWAKVGAGKTKFVRIRYISADTDPRGGVCTDPASSPPISEACFDHFSVDLQLTTEWKYYHVPFADFTQDNSGKHFDAINLEKAYTFEFVLGTNTDFELWVDDLSFYAEQ